MSMNTTTCRDASTTTELVDEENEVTIQAIDEAPDGGYGWVVVIASFFVHVFVLGNIYSFGVFFPIYIDEFHSNQASVAWVGSMGAGLLTFFSAHAGSLSDTYGNCYIVFAGGIFIGAGYFGASYSTELWHLYLTQGLVVGCGYSLAFISGLSVVGQWFTARRGLAVGIAVAGSGLGQYAMSNVTNLLIVHYGWRSTLRYLALITVCGLTLCSLVLKRRLPCAAPVKGESAFRYFYQRDFVFLYLGCFFAMLGMMGPYTHLPQYAKLHDVSTGKAVVILSVMGIASALGRISIGYAADSMGKLLMLKVCMFSGGVSTLCWMVCIEYYAMVIYGGIFAFFAGGVISLMPAVSADQYGLKNLASVMGLLFTSTAMGNLLSAPILGFLYDAYHNYYPSIIFAGSVMLTGCVMVHCVRDVHDKEREMDMVISRSDKERTLSISNNSTTAEDNNNTETYGNYSQINSGSVVITDGMNSTSDVEMVTLGVNPTRSSTNSINNSHKSSISNNGYTTPTKTERGSAVDNEVVKKKMVNHRQQTSSKISGERDEFSYELPV